MKKFVSIAALALIAAGAAAPVIADEISATTAEQSAPVQKHVIEYSEQDGSTTWVEKKDGSAFTAKELDKLNTADNGLTEGVQKEVTEAGGLVDVTNSPVQDASYFDEDPEGKVVARHGDDVVEVYEAEEAAEAKKEAKEVKAANTATSSSKALPNTAAVK